MSRSFNAIDLFSGCGGFSFGFQQAGFNVLLGVDNDGYALKTFERNHKNSKGLNLDLHLPETIDEIAKIVEDKQVDVIIAGPPCQGFSLTGTRNENDKRNTLFYSIFALAEKVKPKAIIIENVPGIAKLYNGKAKDEILRLCEKFNYVCNFKEIFAPDYGVPQIRKRMFFVALSKKLGKYDFPQTTHDITNYVTCEQAIGDLPSLENDLGSEKMHYTNSPFSDYQKKKRNGSEFLFNHVGTNHTDLVKSVISLVPEGGNHKDLPIGVGESRKFNEAWTRYHSKKPSKTIDTGHRNHFHYKWNRVPTIRENARLQSFPDDFIFEGNKTQQNRQVGNAVPPLLGYHIGKQLLKYLNTDE
jgi:DNA (cytosine-5)-methyltransferase 1